jgi:Domain of unknown function (DUF1802)
MKDFTIINIGLCLPLPDIEALIQGRTIVALPETFLRPGQIFALYPDDIFNNEFTCEQYYRSSFLETAKKAIKSQKSEGILLQPQQTSLFPQQEQLTIPLLTDKVSKIKAWAKCEFCQILDETENLEFLSQLTIWTPETLQDLRKRKQHIFLAYLRVYQLSESQEVSTKLDTQEKMGKFFGLPNPITASLVNPVLSDTAFITRKQQLETRQISQNLELEEFVETLETVDHFAAKQLQQNIQIFLGCNHAQIQQSDSDLAWINRIAEVGNSSDGFTFEKLVRRGLLKLGFKNTNSKHIDPEVTGGAGGLDFYCDFPFRLVGECKATKTEKVPDGTAAQLIKLGLKHLPDEFNSCVKLIVAAGELTKPAIQTCIGNKINVITPETLEKLVELQANYQNSINLIELKDCLQQKPFGLADDKVNAYIDRIRLGLKMRSHTIEIMKNYLTKTNYERAGVEALHAAYATSHPPHMLDSQELHDILVELSSPLTGYLGRIKGEDWKRDRFYFLRDLSIT